MNLIFYLEARYIKDDEGNIFNTEGVLRFPLWERYLEVFDHITIVARVKYEPGYQGNSEHLANGTNVSFFELPYFYGPLDFLKKKSSIIKRIKESVDLNGVFLLRVPGQIGTLAAKFLLKNNKKYGVEVVGDPYDVFSKGAVKHPLRIFFKYKYFYDLRRVVSNASSTLYVTEHALQLRYPPKVNTFTTFASNVVLKEDYIRNAPKELGSLNRKIRIISIGSLEQMYKAPDVVLKSVKLVNELQQNFQVELSWLGTGKYLEDMRILAKDLQIENSVSFEGYISDKSEIIAHLDKSDIFVLASRTEGLPRVVIEAMARGLPVIGTRVGGIPELISDKLLIEKNDPQALALKILFLIENSSTAFEEGRRNIEKSRLFSEKVLTNRRTQFYQSLIRNK